MQEPFVSADASVGASPGLEHDDIVKLPDGPAPVRVTCVDYGPGHAQLQEIEDIDGFLAGHRPEWSVVRWINVDGLSHMGVIHALATKYELHPLAVEDLLHLRQRAKVEAYGGDDSELRARLFIVARMLELKDEHLISDQISMFLGHNTVLTFQQEPGDVWDPIRQRIFRSKAHVCASATLVFWHTHCWTRLWTNSFRSSSTTASAWTNWRRSYWAVRSVTPSTRSMTSSAICCCSVRSPGRCGNSSYPYGATLTSASARSPASTCDLYDHVVQVIEIIETFRERASDLTDSYMSRVSNRMNEIMKVLTIIGTIFIPLTFLAGVYGMNFRHFPEIDLVWAYPAFWTICVVVAGIMVLFFRRKDWP